MTTSTSRPTIGSFGDVELGDRRVDAVTAQIKASQSLSALAWSDPAKTIVRTDDQYQSRFLSMRALVH